jgi:hypothetical protein
MSPHVGSNPTPSAILVRRGVRVAEGARLEIVYTSKRRVEGSNPSLSASGFSGRSQAPARRARPGRASSGPAGFEDRGFSVAVLDGEVAVPCTRNPL